MDVSYTQEFLAKSCFQLKSPFLKCLNSEKRTISSTTLFLNDKFMFGIYWALRGNKLLQTSGDKF